MRERGLQNLSREMLEHQRLGLEHLRTDLPTGFEFTCFRAPDAPRILVDFLSGACETFLARDTDAYPLKRDVLRFTQLSVRQGSNLKIKASFHLAKQKSAIECPLCLNFGIQPSTGRERAS